ncbi:MAG: RNA polymerase sigma factor [Eubacterium sp.]|nr:RNA polymerase sigma factor [Eubacterium sp.]
MQLTDSSAPDDVLYRRYREGDTASGDALMLRYADVLTTYLNSLLDNVHDAEDLMLETFAVILIDKPKIREGCFRAYLFKVARNKANRLWKTKIRRGEFSLSEEILAEDKPEQEVLSGELATVIHHCLNRIAAQYREALWLVYIMELSYEQAAEVLKCGKKRIDNLLLNGKKAMRIELEKEGITDSKFA